MSTRSTKHPAALRVETSARARGARTRLSRPTANTVTVLDVAKAARVSMATVSRVLNGNMHVDDDLRRRVTDAAKRLGYTPHAAARALASQRSWTIGAVIPTLENVNFAVGVAALQRRISDAGYTLLLGSSNYDRAEELRQVKALAAHGVAGMMLVGGRHAPEVYDLLNAKRIPFVNAWVLDRKHPCVGFDNREIGRALARYLIELGHIRFGVISQVARASDRASERVAGIREVLAGSGAPPPREQLIERPYKIDEGRTALCTLMEAAPRPTAVICGTDMLAFGALIGARQLRLAVPRDLSIAGINDIEYAAHLSPPLTTIRLPADEVGHRAADYLLGRINRGETMRESRVAFNLVVRDSTAAPGA
jgi:LacI family transcriptional regulator